MSCWICGKEKGQPPEKLAATEQANRMATDLYQQATARAEAAEKELAEAREALKPFAEGFRMGRMESPPSEHAMQLWAKCAEFERAAAVLAKQGKERG